MIVRILLLCLLFISSCGSKPKNEPEISVPLEETIFRLNNQFLYDSSIIMLRRILQNSTSKQEKYEVFLYLSFTYKRMFKYPQVMENLDSAEYYGQQTDNSGYYQANIDCQKAFVHFDIQEYKLSDELMQKLKLNNYEYLNNENKAKIIMQEGYLYFLDKKFMEAERYYNQAIEWLSKSSSCDLPMIYGKQIELYGTMKQEKKMQQAYQNGLLVADSCKIFKYAMYCQEMLYKVYRDADDKEKMLQNLITLERMKEIYQEKEDTRKIIELEKAYDLKSKEARIYQQELELTKQGKWIYYLIVLVLLLLSIFIIYDLYRKQRFIKKENIIRQNYTQHLFQNTETERQRLARGLHDELGHKLLEIKMLSSEKEVIKLSQELINDVRNISRDLWPVMFEKAGLVSSVEQWAERVSQRHQFIIALESNYEKGLDTTVEIHLFRIIQEAINNTIKYAEAHAAKISILESNAQYIVEMKDNGKGFDYQAKLQDLQSFGLHSMIERANIIGAKINFSSSNGGTISYIILAKTNT